MKTGQKARTFNMKHIPTSKGVMTVFSIGESKKNSAGNYENLGYINCVVYEEVPITDWVIIGTIYEVKFNKYTNKQGQLVTQTQVVIDLIGEENIENQYSEVTENNTEITAEDLPF